MTMIFHAVVYCMNIIWSSFSCFNTDLSCEIVCNTCITCNIYNFDNKSQYTVQLPVFILETLLTDVNTYLSLTACITSYVKVYYNGFFHPGKCHEPL